MIRLALVIILSAISVGICAKENKHILFFYSANCQFCHQMIPVLEHLQNNNKISIIANSIDDIIPNKFDASLQNLELFRAFKISSFPILIGVDLKKNDFEVICQGMEGELEVMRRVLEWHQSV